MAVVGGIDEAGYGPRLGPLVVSATAFRVPDGQAETCLWQLLSAAVCRSPSDRHGRLAVDDSKKLFSQATGVRHLERASLAFAAAAARMPTSFRGLLSALADLAEDADAYPWYAGADFPVPLAAEAPRLARDAERLRRAGDVRFLGARILPVLVREYNRLVDGVGTKSAALFLKTSQLLAWLWEQWGEEGLVVLADKHGGRDRYGLLLHQTFFGATVKVLGEGRQASLYEVVRGPRRMRIAFHANGDAKHMPIALGSVYSKYLRELFMRSFNAYWTGHVPGLRPTAGYAADARRFLRDIEPARQRLGVDLRLLVRIV
ncbi:MAG: hypothetical protein ACLF0G_12760 [Candidatus Brocadiia bacterium]